MKRYVVEITDEALADMEQLYNHIAYVLQAPENAMNQYTGSRLPIRWLRESTLWNQTRNDAER